MSSNSNQARKYDTERGKQLDKAIEQTDEVYHSFIEQWFHSGSPVY
jgi:hypothetical protein